MKLLCLALFLLVLIDQSVGKQNLYLDESIGSDNNNCTEEFPCKSLFQTFSVVSESEAKIFIAPGLYSGPENTDLTFPDADIELQGENTQTVLFSCTRSEDTCFLATNGNVTVTNLTIQNCRSAILTNQHNVDIQFVDFVNISRTAIGFDGGNILNIFSVKMENETNPIYLQGDISQIFISNVNVNITTGSAIYSEAKIEYIELNNSNFLDIPEIDFTYGTVNYGVINNCSFYSTYTALSTGLGSWNIADSYFFSKGNCISYSGDKDTSLNITNTVFEGTSGILLYTEPSVYMDNIEFNVSNIGIRYMYSRKILIIENSSFFKTNFPISNGFNDLTDSAIDSSVIISNVTTKHSGSIQLSSTPNSSGLIKNCVFKDNTNQTLNLVNGNWIVENTQCLNSAAALDTAKGGAIYLKSGNITIDNSIFSTCVAPEAGGALYLENITSVNISKSNFTGCSSKKGGAIFISDYDSFHVEDCVFSGNSGTVTGGAIQFQASQYPAEFGTVEFSYNFAKNGAALYCGSTFESTVDFSEEATVILLGNTNVDGTDISCPSNYEDTAGNEYEYEESSINWAIWGTIIAVDSIMLLIVLLMLSVMGYFYLKKRTQNDLIVIN